MTVEIEVVLTSHTAWWLRLVNWAGADMTWTHALLRFDDHIIEAVAEGVIKRPWSTDGWEGYGRFRLEEGPSELASERMRSFAEGEVGKRYKYEVLPLILVKILQRIPRPAARFIGVGEVCTSLVDNTFSHGGFDLVPTDKRPYVLPDDFAESELLVRCD